MVKYIIIVLILILGSLTVLYFQVGISGVYEETVHKKTVPHVYGNPEQSIKNIHITALYFVPKDRTESQDKQWVEKLERVLREIKEFHENQFLGTSHITYSFLPTPIIGLEKSSEYGTDALHFGNPSEMKIIIEELRSNLDVPELQNTFNVTVVMYEGVGSASGENISLISRSFLTSTFGTTELAHEFYHSLNIPEGYDLGDRFFADSQRVKIEALTSPDIMGQIRVPIERSYLSRETLSRMGL